jgi:hypothetical protein
MLDQGHGYKKLTRRETSTDQKQTKRRWPRYVAEFSVVFFGVWLSLMAEEWRQDRQDRLAEELALEGIAQELAADIQDMEINLERARRGFSAATWLVENRTMIPDADRVATALTEIGPCSFPFMASSQYTTLKSSGDLNLIRNRQLRGSIAEVYELRNFLGWLHERDCLESSGLFDVLAPLTTFAIHEPVAGGTNEWSADIDSVDDVAALYDDGEVIDRVAKLASHRQFLIDWIGRELEKTKALRETILSELSGS